MKTGCSQGEIDGVVSRIEELGLKEHISLGIQHTIVGVLGQTSPELHDALELLPGVEEVIPISKPYKLASREFHPDNTIIDVGDIRIGGEEIVVIAGPCSVESREQVLATAEAVKSAGAAILRGGAFKPRTSPYQFRGLREEGLEILAEAREKTGMPVITEIMSSKEIDLVVRYADILQVGARNMQNFVLLDELGKIRKPILLKRGLSSTIQEWLLAAEYILSQGNEQVILCERGIRTFESYTRFTMDISAIPVIKKLSHLPIIADPSHATGKWYLVAPMAFAALAAGADGLTIEVHPNPEQALSDGPQSLTFDNFHSLMTKVASIVQASGRRLAKSSIETKV
jgi:3-deoxy-7-phosphoheptulonate synthase